MHVRRMAWLVCMVVSVATICPLGLRAQRNSPLDAGASAIDRKDFASAERILSGYLATHPKHMDEVDAMLLLGKTRIELKNFDGAIDVLDALLKEEPKDWYAHIFLVQAYAEKGDWPDFHREREMVKQARDAKRPGVDYGDDGDVIDLLTINGESYLVKSYYRPGGPHHTHYVFLHVGGDGNVKDLLTCDSDDGDQIDFKQHFPKEAAAGARRFSLDPWVVTDRNLVHGHVIALYDGEPTYEVLRADVLKVLTFDAGQGRKIAP
jgi:hypothetical protein